jgi:hypothetical protein
MWYDAKKASPNTGKRGARMIQCLDCQFCETGPDGRRTFKCDPFVNVVEPECIQKWQLLRLDMLVASYQSMLQLYQRMAPMQDKLFKYMEREINEMNESENWKVEDEPDPDEPMT